MHTFPWMGSKRRLAGEILKRFPEHKTYVEAFAGSASVLLAREEPARVEVLNDLDGDIANFFRVCKHHQVEHSRAGSNPWREWIEAAAAVVGAVFSSQQVAWGPA